ncbi:MAG: hypothetical protein AAFY14_02305 [Pseudomonadota bacterium]
MPFSEQLTLFGFIACIYAACAYGAFVRAKKGAKVYIGRVLALVLIAAALWSFMRESSYWRFQVIGAIFVFLGFILPVLFFGTSWFLGAVIGRLSRWRIAFSYLIVGVLALPFCFFGMGLYGDYQLQQERQLKTMAFRQKQIDGQFGSHRISIPVTPQARMRFACSRGDHGIETTCSWPFQEPSELDPDDPSYKGNQTRIIEIELRRVHETCVAEDGSEMIHCRRFEDLEEWCATRQDRPSTIWCGQTESDRIVFVYEPERETMWSMRSGTVIDVSHIPEDLQRGGLEIKCWDHELRGRGCEGQFTVASDVTVHLLLPNADETNVSPRVIAARNYAQSLWDDLTGYSG